MKLGLHSYTIFSNKAKRSRKRQKMPMQQSQFGQTPTRPAPILFTAMAV